MELQRHLQTAITTPQLFRGHQPIFMLSHMRANTSLLGHILGSNPAIAGYYEMHIGYYSWKSLLRQKLLYYSSHDYKPGTRYIFDKVLHNYHKVEPGLLNRANAKVLIVIREPVKTVQSIVNLFRSKDKEHEYKDIRNATDYYCQRLEYLQGISKEINSYYFLEASQIRENTGECLAGLTQWLGLAEPLKPEFQQFPFTGKLGAGDSSGNLNAGKLAEKHSEYGDIQLTEQQVSESMQVYERSLAKFQAGAINK